MPLEWKTLDERIIIKDRWIDLRAEKCVTPGGTVLDPFYVVRLPDFVHVVALTDTDEIVLTEEYRHAIQKRVLNLPGGWIDPGEEPLAAARRELAEETGFVSENWRFITRFAADVGQNNWVHVFLATGAKAGVARNPEPGEEGMKVARMPLQNLFDQLNSAFLPHSAHIAALLLALMASGRVALKPEATPRNN